MNDYIFITYPLCIVEKLKKKGNSMMFCLSSSLMSCKCFLFDFLGAGDICISRQPKNEFNTRHRTMTTTPASKTPTAVVYVEQIFGYRFKDENFFHQADRWPI